MAPNRQIEIFSADCPLCRGAVDQVRAAACPSCDIVVHVMADPATAARAEELGVRAVPAVAIDGVLADGAAGGGIDMKKLQAAGLGQPL